jgi:hypothetical protein
VAATRCVESRRYVRCWICRVVGIPVTAGVHVKIDKVLPKCTIVRSYFPWLNGLGHGHNGEELLWDVFAGFSRLFLRVALSTWKKDLAHELFNKVALHGFVTNCNLSNLHLAGGPGPNPLHFCGGLHVGGRICGSKRCTSLFGVRTRSPRVRRGAVSMGRTEERPLT